MVFFTGQRLEVGSKVLDCWLTGADFVGMSKNSFFADDVQEETSREPDLPNKVYFEIYPLS